MAVGEIAFRNLKK